VRAARKLIGDMDKTKPEVVVDVIVMETSRSRSRQISAAFVGRHGVGNSGKIHAAWRSGLIHRHFALEARASVIGRFLPVAAGT